MDEYSSHNGQRTQFSIRCQRRPTVRQLEAQGVAPFPTIFGIEFCGVFLFGVRGRSTHRTTEGCPLDMQFLGSYVPHDLVSTNGKTNKRLP